MSICLVVQRDTLENNKVKSILTACEESPKDFVKKLQENHCIEYQLLAFTSADLNVAEKLSSIIDPCKTNYGKFWYEFDHKTLARILSVFFKHSETVVDFTCISSIIGFSLSMFPVVTKEIVVSKITKEEPKKEEPKPKKEEDGSRRKKETKKKH